jgi:mannosyltransferase
MRGRTPACSSPPPQPSRDAVRTSEVLLVGAFRDPAYEASVRARIAALGLERAVRVTGFLPIHSRSSARSTCWRTRRTAIRFHWRCWRAWRSRGRSSRRPSAASRRCSSMVRVGFLVPPDDAAALAGAIIPLLRDPAARRASGAGHQRLVHRFSLDGFARTMFGAFDLAVSDRRG